MVLQDVEIVEAVILREETVVQYVHRGKEFEVRRMVEGEGWRTHVKGNVREGERKEEMEDEEVKEGVEVENRMWDEL